jgi:hypothetical protein
MRNRPLSQPDLLQDAQCWHGQFFVIEEHIVGEQVLLLLLAINWCQCLLW